MWFFSRCSDCKEYMESADDPIISYFKEIEGCRVTKACCLSCSEKDHEKWIENGYQKVKDD